MRASSILALAAVVLAVPAVAQEAQRPPSLEELDRVQDMDEATAALEHLRGIADKVQKKRVAHCLRAFGAASFCDCLNGNLPSLLSFGEYIGIVTATRADLGYEQLGADDQKLVDKTYLVREQCVAAHAGNK